MGAGAVELMRTMIGKSKVKGHLWPMAMYSWEVMPPPAGLEKDLGERRLTGYAGTGHCLLCLVHGMHRCRASILPVAFFRGGSFSGGLAHWPQCCMPATPALVDALKLSLET